MIFGPCLTLFLLNRIVMFDIGILVILVIVGMDLYMGFLINES